MLTDMATTLVGSEVRRARLAKGYTLQQVSDMTGIPLRTIHGLESGETKYPNENTLRHVADALDVNYRHLALLVYGEVEAKEAIPA